MRWAIESFEETLGQRPLGWYCRYGPSVHTRELLVEEGGFVYDADAYNDDLPYFTEGVGGAPPRRALQLHLQRRPLRAAAGLWLARRLRDHAQARLRHLLGGRGGAASHDVGRAPPATSSSMPSTRAASGSPGASTSPSGGLLTTKSSRPEPVSRAGRSTVRPPGPRTGSGEGARTAVGHGRPASRSSRRSRGPSLTARPITETNFGARVHSRLPSAHDRVLRSRLGTGSRRPPADTAPMGIPSA